MSTVPLLIASAAVYSAWRRRLRHTDLVSVVYTFYVSMAVALSLGYTPYYRLGAQCHIVYRCLKTIMLYRVCSSCPTQTIVRSSVVHRLILICFSVTAFLAILVCGIYYLLYHYSLRTKRSDESTNPNISNNVFPTPWDACVCSAWPACLAGLLCSLAGANRKNDAFFLCQCSIINVFLSLKIDKQ